MHRQIRKVTVPEWKHIPAGTTIPNGYPNGYCTAPEEPGFYTLYQLVDAFNCHQGWHWEKEMKDDA